MQFPQIMTLAEGAAPIAMVNNPATGPADGQDGGFGLLLLDTLSGGTTAETVELAEEAILLAEGFPHPAPLLSAELVLTGSATFAVPDDAVASPADQQTLPVVGDTAGAMGPPPPAPEFPAKMAEAAVVAAPYLAQSPDGKRMVEQDTAIRLPETTESPAPLLVAKPLPEQPIAAAQTSQLAPDVAARPQDPRADVVPAAPQSPKVQKAQTPQTDLPDVPPEPDAMVWPSKGMAPIFPQVAKPAGPSHGRSDPALPPGPLEPATVPAPVLARDGKEPAVPADRGDRVLLSVKPAGRAEAASQSPLLLALLEPAGLPDDPATLPLPLAQTAIGPATNGITAPAQNIAQQIIQAVAQSLQTAPASAGEKLELTLQPEELGRIQFDLSPKGDSIRLMVFVERPETLDLMRRHAELLLAELRNAGFGTTSLDMGNWGQREGTNPKSAEPKQNTVFVEGLATAITPTQPAMVAEGRLHLRL